MQASASRKRRRSSDSSLEYEPSPRQEKYSSGQLLYGRWYNVIRDTPHVGSNEFNFRFAKLYKNEKVLVERCKFNGKCRCVTAGQDRNMSFATVKTVTGFQGHIDTACLDVNNVLKIYCPICQKRTVSEHEFFQHFIFDHFEPFLKSYTKHQYSLRCPMFDCNHDKNKVFRDKEDLIDHIFDFRQVNGAGRSHFLRFFVMLCMNENIEKSDSKDDPALLKTRLNEIQSEFTKLQDRYSKCDKNEKTYQNVLKNKDDRIKELENERVQHVEDMKTMTAQVQQYKEQKRQGKELCNQMKQLNHDLNEKVVELETKLTYAQDKCSQLEKTEYELKIEALEKKLKAAEDRNSAMEKTIKENDAKEDLQLKMNENAKLSYKIAQTMKTLNMKSEELTKMEQILALRNQEISVLRQDKVMIKPESK